MKVIKKVDPAEYRKVDTCDSCESEIELEIAATKTTI